MERHLPPNLMQRAITAVGLIAFVMVMMYFGGAVFGIAAMLCISIAIYEEFQALKACHRIVAWPTWAGLALGVPLTLTLGIRVILGVMMAICLTTMLVIMFRKEPRLTDIIMSLLPLCTIALPGMCMIAVAMVWPKGLQVILLCLIFAVPVVCDTFAYFIGSRVGGPKLCPEISPKKTQSGAIGGMLGAVLASMLVCAGASAWLDPATRALCPTWWGFLLLGLIGGVASQLGDLFASMVKRHCGIKDFSNLFPGHGGMLDRLDSILFMAVIIMCYRLYII